MKRRTKPVVALDGPAGAGKSTAARRLADALGFIYVDTGALFRAITYLAISHELPLNEGSALATLARRVRLEFRRPEPGTPLRLHINDVDRSAEIRRPEIEKEVSGVAKLPEVREVLTDLMRELGRDGGVVLEGRDIGTVVFPDAEVKVFLTASLEVRAKRHQGALKARGVVHELSRVMTDLAERDRIDSTREIAPLKKADDADLLDTSDLNEDEVLVRLKDLVRFNSPTSEHPLPKS